MLIYNFSSHLSTHFKGVKVFEIFLFIIRKREGEKWGARKYLHIYRHKYTRLKNFVGLEFCFVLIFDNVRMQVF